MFLSARDQTLLVFLDRTAATAAQIMRASVSFGGESFSNERRARERLQSLRKQGLVRTFAFRLGGGGTANYYKLTPEGYRVVRGAEAQLPHRSHFADIPPSRIAHTFALGDVIAHTLASAHTCGITVTGFHRENELSLTVGEHSVFPDCHVQFTTGGRTFNVLVELDLGTESVDSPAMNSIRAKLLAYEAYQDHLWGIWKSQGKAGPRPYFRVVFFTETIDRAYHILHLAKECVKNSDRKLCYAATRETFLAEEKAVMEPLFLDHRGHWQALVNPHPSSRFERSPVRIVPLNQRSLGF